ncbi:MAG: DNA (cytosine-5-)-methyltransferase [Phycisphaerales bacterium]|nr:DNA (cytosine-5-)-methyltransferase [Phycisphaerales bacterium]
MSGSAADKKRLIRVTEGNLRNNHLYVKDHLDFFPGDVIGGSRCNGHANGNGGAQKGFDLRLDGLNEVTRTDIGSDKDTGKPRGFLRCRGLIGRFYRHHAVKPGTFVTLERLSERSYRVCVPPRSPQAAEPFTAAEFFAGIGLVRLALERQGWSVLFANDIDPGKAKMYRDNWPEDETLVVGDIHNVSAAEVPTCQLFTASFPCNDLSIAGRWEGLNGRESSAFWGLIRILREMGERRPQLLLIENVLGFLMSRRGQDFEQALLSLNNLGYVVDAMILNALHWTPQSRVRLFVVARLDDGRERRTMAMECQARPDLLCVFINTHPNIRWDIQSLPSLPRRRKQLAEIVERLAEDDPDWWSEDRATYFFRQLSSRHEAEAHRMIKGRSYTYATAFRRVRNDRSMAELRTDGIAGCLRTPRGGSGRQILFKAGRGRFRVRLLTARECARLQGVPDSYKIDVPLNRALFGFGDAVCVPAVEWIAKNYLKLLLATSSSPVVSA